MKAYDEAVTVLLKARETWPELFQTGNVDVEHIPSSDKAPNPFKKKPPDAESCIGRMTNDKSIVARYREFAANLQKFDLDDRIREQCTKDTFRPVVHSEPLVYNWITTEGSKRGLRFFNGWKYVGSSKPTCKLCDYFFDAVDDDIARRPSHGNIYLNWRLPEGYGVAAGDPRTKVYFGMNNRVRDEAFRMMSSKCSTSKSHDSDTYSCWTKKQTVETTSTYHDDAESVVSMLGNRFEASLVLVEEGEEDDGNDGVTLEEA